MKKRIVKVTFSNGDVKYKPQFQIEDEWCDMYDEVGEWIIVNTFDEAYAVINPESKGHFPFVINEEILPMIYY